MKVWRTDTAALHVAFPFWPAVSVHRPAPTSVTSSASTLHTAGLADIRLTGRPELACATASTGGAPKIWLAIGRNVMV